jgi:hypothetical protein
MIAKIAEIEKQKRKRNSYHAPGGRGEPAATGASKI